MHFILEIVRLGLWNLHLHKLRSFLTSLGIILGVGAVIVMVAIGEGRKQAALTEIEALGATNIIARSVRPPESSSMGSESRQFIASFGILRSDLERLQAFLPDARSIVPLKSVGDEVSYREKRVVSQAFGTTPDFVDIARLHVARGRYLADEDMLERANVAVIGHEVAEQFFPIEDPLGKEIRIGQRIVRIVGILRPVGMAGGTGSALVGRNLNLDIHIPMTTAEIEFGDVVQRRVSGSFSGEEVQVGEIYIAAPSTDAVLTMAERVERAIDVEHADKQDVEIIVPWELLEQAKREARVMNVMLTLIAAISLLVGGIGIMNIMLASVTERTREIGIRRALGATRRHIVLQFLVETGSLSAVGGLLGVVSGVAVAVGIEKVLPELLKLPVLRSWFQATDGFNTHVTLWSIWISFGVAALVGLVFGVYPAIEASKKDPIEALRHD